MTKVTLTREPSTDAGTFGVLTLTVDGKEHVFQSLELPWRGNQRNVSCIPPGKYLCAFGPCGLKSIGNAYRLSDVPGRDGILIHRGNWAGDKSMGLKSDVHGCILLGMIRGKANDQPAVLQSRTAVGRFEGLLNRQPFQLQILDPEPSA